MAIVIGTMIAKVLSVALTGFSASLIEVETDMKQGLPGIQIVGMGNKAIDEARERVRSAIPHSLLQFPARKLTINLAPAELPKDGTHFDLPIALSILVAAGELKQSQVLDAVFIGELALDGSLRPVRGVINSAEAAAKAGMARIYVPVANQSQAALVDSIEVIGISTLKELYLHLKGEHLLSSTPSIVKIATPSPEITLDDIHGHAFPKRALEIAAAGRHNILLFGPPGTGKTLLARALVGLLPPLNKEEMLEVTKIHSLAREIDGDIITARPFRSPHHTTTASTIIGGGGKPKPGEVSLAHKGVLFLDELPEFARATLEALRQPLEDKKVLLSRTNSRITYPADFMLVATMNPCPCGHYGDSVQKCRCSAVQIETYQKRISGPLFDRIDLVIHVNREDTEKLFYPNSLKENQQMKVLDNIKVAANQQNLRYKSSSINNASLTSKHVTLLLTVSSEARDLLATASTRLGFSTRSYFKVLKVAQTIADLARSHDIKAEHIAEALQLRSRLPS